MKNSLKFGLALWCILTVAAALLTYVYFTMPKKDEELGIVAGFATMSWFIASWGMMMFLPLKTKSLRKSRRKPSR